MADPSRNDVAGPSEAAGEPGSAAAAGNVARALDAEAPEPASGAWYLQLLFQPGVFIRRYTDGAPIAAFMAAAWVDGIATMIGRTDWQLYRQALTRRDPVGFAADVVGSWGHYWLWVTGIGVLAGLLRYYLGGWFFRARLGWAGDIGADRDRARRVYILACTVYAVPTLVSALCCAILFASPSAAYSSALTTVRLAFSFWASFILYKSARTMFYVERGKALLWFLWLPWSLTLVVIWRIAGA